MSIYSKSTKQNNFDSSSTNDLLGLSSASNDEDTITTLVSECESHCDASTSTIKEDPLRVDAKIWELLSSSRGEHDDVDCEHESGISSFKISPATTNNEEIECEGVDKDVLDVLILGDSDSFRLLSTPEQKKEGSTRKRSIFQDGMCDDIDGKLRQIHKKRARRAASVFDAPPDQPRLQELRRKRPVCLFINFLGTRCSQEDEKSSSSRTAITTQTSVSSVKVSEFPKSEPSDLPTKSVSLITASKKIDTPSSPHLVTPEGLKMLKRLGLGICPCKMNKKHSTMSFQASKDPSLSSCCFPALPLAPV